MFRSLNNLHNLREEGVVHILVLAGVVAVSILLGAMLTSSIKTTRESAQIEPNIKGVLIAKGGDDSSGSSGGDSSGSSGSGSSGSSNSGIGSSDSESSDTSVSKDSNEGDSSGSSGSGSSTTNSNPTATPKPRVIKTEFRPKPTSNSSAASGVRVQTEESLEKTRTEIKFSETEKIKARVEDDRTRIDVYRGGIKIRYEIRDGRVIVKAETEEGVDVPEQELFKIDDRLSASGIKVATGDGKLVVSRNNIGAVSNFPFQIDLNTNQLIASTSAGTKILTTLPDQAVQNIIAANVISRLTPQDLSSQAQLGNITSIQDVITLGERNGLPVYEINGLKEQKLLGFIPITTSTKVFVSAETGQPLAQEQSLLTNIIDFLSP